MPIAKAVKKKTGVDAAPLVQSASQDLYTIADARADVITNNVNPVAIGGSVGADDTLLMGVIIAKQAATAATVTIAGFQNAAGQAKTLMFVGSTVQDTVITFGGLGIRNVNGVMTAQVNVADAVTILWKGR